MQFRCSYCGCTWLPTFTWTDFLFIVEKKNLFSQRAPFNTETDLSSLVGMTRAVPSLWILVLLFSTRIIYWSFTSISNSVTAGSSRFYLTFLFLIPPLLVTPSILRVTDLLLHRFHFSSSFIDLNCCFRMSRRQSPFPCCCYNLHFCISRRSQYLIIKNTLLRVGVRTA